MSELDVLIIKTVYNDYVLIVNKEEVAYANSVKELLVIFSGHECLENFNANIRIEN